MDLRINVQFSNVLVLIIVPFYILILDHFLDFEDVTYAINVLFIYSKFVIGHLLINEVNISLSPMLITDELNRKKN